jgi:hypothetical protein
MTSVDRRPTQRGGRSIEQWRIYKRRATESELVEPTFFSKPDYALVRAFGRVNRDSSSPKHGLAGWWVCWLASLTPGSL